MHGSGREVLTGLMHALPPPESAGPMRAVQVVRRLPRMARGFDDAGFSFAAGAGVSGAYCRSLDDDRRAAARAEFYHRLGVSQGPFRLEAHAWAVRGRASADHG